MVHSWIRFLCATMGTPWTFLYLSFRACVHTFYWVWVTLITSRVSVYWTSLNIYIYLCYIYNIMYYKGWKLRAKWSSKGEVQEGPDEPESSWILARFVTRWTTRELPQIYLLYVWYSITRIPAVIEGSILKFIISLCFQWYFNMRSNFHRNPTGRIFREDPLLLIQSAWGTKVITFIVFSSGFSGSRG